VAAFAVAMLVAAAACGDDGDNEDAAAASTTVAERVTVQFPFNSFPGVLGVLKAVIEENGLEAKHGIDLDVKLYATTDEPQQALAAGGLDVGYFSLLGWAKLKNEGRDLVVLAPLLNDSGTLVVKADSPYESLADLKGKKIATLPAGSGIYNDLAIMSKLDGIDWETEYQHVPGPPPALVGFLEGGQVEGIVVFQPHVAKLEATGKYKAITTVREDWQKKFKTPMYSLMLVANGGWVKEHPVEAQRLQELFADALDRVAGNPEEIAKYAEALGVTEAEMQKAAPRMATEFVPSDLTKAEAGSRKVLAEAVKAGILTEAPKPVITKP
jgi:NitT/TauT family transport system substrate-binding protein